MKKMNQLQMIELTQRIAGLMYKKLMKKMTKSEEAMLQEFMDELDAMTKVWYAEIVLPDAIDEALEDMCAVNVEAAFEDVKQRIGMSRPAYSKYRRFSM